MKLKTLLKFTALATGAMYAGFVGGNFLEATKTYREALCVAQNENNATELRESARQYAQRVEDSIFTTRMLLPFTRVEPAPYEPVFRLR